MILLIIYFLLLESFGEFGFIQKSENVEKRMFLVWRVWVWRVSESLEKEIINKIK